MIKLRGLLAESQHVSGQQLMLHTTGVELNKTLSALNKKFPNWEFKAYPEHGVSSKDAYTITYDSNATNSDEVIKVKNLLKRLLKK